MAPKTVSGLPELRDPNEVVTITAPEWLRRPADIKPITKYEDFANRANDYFTECLETETRPTITGLALATGLPGPTSLIRLGQRIPALRAVISRCMTAVAHQYEQIVASGGASGGAQFMLKNIPDFDPDDPEGSPGVQFFNDRKEILLQAEVFGAAVSGEDYADVDPIEVYLSVIKRSGGGAQPKVIQDMRKEQGSPLKRILTIIEPESVE